ncbi:MAG: hypothetical protein IJ228_12045 [Succinivibrio sp.]|nr:hypothetical protein [Succinivibrio sp.]
MNRLKGLWQLALLYLLCALSSVVAVVLLFQLNLLRYLLPVYFYRGLCYILTAALLTGLFSLWLTHRLRRTHAEGVQSGRFSFAHACCITCCSLCLWSTFFCMVPVILDRSFSVFLLGWMYEHPQPVTKEEVAKAFNLVYAERYDMFGRRLEEQLITGNHTHYLKS